MRKVFCFTVKYAAVFFLFFCAVLLFVSVPANSSIKNLFSSLFSFFPFCLFAALPFSVFFITATRSGSYHEPLVVFIAGVIFVSVPVFISSSHPEINISIDEKQIYRTQSGDALFLESSNGDRADFVVAGKEGIDQESGRMILKEGSAKFIFGKRIIEYAHIPFFLERLMEDLGSFARIAVNAANTEPLLFFMMISAALFFYMELGCFASFTKNYFFNFTFSFFLFRIFSALFKRAQDIDFSGSSFFVLGGIPLILSFFVSGMFFFLINIKKGRKKHERV